MLCERDQSSESEMLKAIFSDNFFTLNETKLTAIATYLEFFKEQESVTEILCSTVSKFI